MEEDDAMNQPAPTVTCKCGHEYEPGFNISHSYCMRCGHVNSHSPRPYFVCETRKPGQKLSHATTTTSEESPK